MHHAVPGGKELNTSAKRRTSMLANRLIQLIENHSKSLTHAVMHDIETSEHTRAFRKVPKEELEPRIAATYQNLGSSSSFGTLRKARVCSLVSMSCMTACVKDLEWFSISWIRRFASMEVRLLAEVFNSFPPGTAWCITRACDVNHIWTGALCRVTPHMQRGRQPTSKYESQHRSILDLAKAAGKTPSSALPPGPI